METDIQTGRTSHEDEGRVWGDGSTSQEMPKIGNKPLEAKGQAQNRFFLVVPRRSQLC